ncbi:MAG: SpoIIE family protein phosphatase [bacterium]|nr:SpoIIE family protein phosphatase [bacterium]
MTEVGDNRGRLVEAIDASILQEMQDAFAALAGASLSVCDARGRAVTRPTCHSPLCRALQDSATGQAACGRSVEQAAEAAAPADPSESTSASRSSCHIGMDQVVVPIEFEGDHLGSIVVEQPAAQPVAPKRLRSLAREHGLDEAALVQASTETNPPTGRRRETALNCARMLARTIAHLCHQDAMIRNRVEELSAVYNLAGMLSGTQDLEAILKVTPGRVAEVMGVKSCGIRLLDEATGELVVKAVHNLSDEYLNKGPVVLGENPIDEAAFAGQTIYIADAATDPRTRYPEQARREGIVSGLCVALTYRGRAVGVIRVYSSQPHRFSPFEVSLLRAVASQVAAAIVNARLFAQRQAAERYRRQLDYAGEIQRRMIPAGPPSHERIALAGVYAPSLEVGGDFYDFIQLPGGNLGVCIADVVGKGVPAALMMASVRSALRGHAHSIYDLHEIIAQVNQHLCRDTQISEFATLFYGVFDPDGGRITYCNAGHEPPLLLRGDDLQRLEAGGMVIGVRPDEVFDKDVVALESGDVLVFYTDGVTEALNFDGEAFGRERLAASIRRHCGESAQTLAQQVVWDVRRFAGLAPQTDDITVVAAKVG